MYILEKTLQANSKEDFEKTEEFKKLKEQKRIFTYFQFSDFCKINVYRNISEEELYDLTIEELKELKKDLEKHLKELQNDTIYDVVDEIEEDEATAELMEDLVDNGNKQEDILQDLRSIDEVLKFKLSE